MSEKQSDMGNSSKAHSGGKDFSKGKVWSNIMVQSLPLILAQLVQLLYNVVDRIYIGHLPGTDSLALTGIGLGISAYNACCRIYQSVRDGRSTALFDRERSWK